MQSSKQALKGGISNSLDLLAFPNEVLSSSLFLSLLSNIRPQQHLPNFALGEKLLALCFPDTGFPIQEMGYLQPSSCTLIFCYVL